MPETTPDLRNLTRDQLRERTIKYAAQLRAYQNEYDDAVLRLMAVERGRETDEEKMQSWRALAEATANRVLIFKANFGFGFCLTHRLWRFRYCGTWAGRVPIMLRAMRSTMACLRVLRRSWRLPRIWSGKLEICNDGHEDHRRRAAAPARRPAHHHPPAHGHWPRIGQPRHHHFSGDCEALGMPEAEATKMMTARQWHEGNVARLEAAAAWLGVSVDGADH